MFFWGVCVFLSKSSCPVDVNQVSGITGPEVFIFLPSFLFKKNNYVDCGVLKDSLCKICKHIFLVLCLVSEYFPYLGFIGLWLLWGVGALYLIFKVVLMF